MINLLFISGNPRSELLRVHFQQILKIRIEVVEDFDRGLKDVFEKRPVTVCIQEQIAGVTGESVARHIQLLLGNGAPGFILMHDGSAKAKVVPGLFSHLIDLSAPFDVVCQSLQLALQAQLGDIWNKVYLPPQQELTEPGAPASVADQLIDELMAETSIFKPENAAPLPGMEPHAKTDDFFVEDLPGGPPAEPESARSEVLVAPAPQKAEPSVAVHTTDVAQPSQPKIVQQPVAPVPERQNRQVRKVSDPTAEPEKTVTDDDSSVPVHEMLQAFEENYHSSRRLRLRLAIAAVTVLAVSGLVWSFLQGYLKLPSTRPEKQQSVAIPLQRPPLQAVVSSAKPVAPPDHARTEKPATLPSFIHGKAQDHGFSSKKPGWSRYLDKQRDYRLFHADGRLKALQVLVVGSGSISASELKQVLVELTGSERYHTDKHEKKSGLHLERASLSEGAELLIYRTASKGPIKAFVLELKP